MITGPACVCLYISGFCVTYKLTRECWVRIIIIINYYYNTVWYSTQIFVFHGTETTDTNCPVLLSWIWWHRSVLRASVHQPKGHWSSSVRFIGGPQWLVLVWSRAVYVPDAAELNCNSSVEMRLYSHSRFLSSISPFACSPVSRASQGEYFFLSHCGSDCWHQQKTHTCYFPTQLSDTITTDCL